MNLTVNIKNVGKGLHLTDVFISILFITCCLQILYLTQRHEFGVLISVYSVFFITYLYVLKTRTQTDFYLKLGILLRGIAVFSFPNLSDDIYRFLWDGHLINLGENPFSYAPQYYFESQQFSNILTPELYARLNSPTYYSVYPTFCQAVFTVATFLFPKSIYGATWVIKCVLFACEIGTLLLMKKMLRDSKNVLIYALNPLIIIELVGNVHFEASMIFFFIASIYMLQKGDILSQRTPLERGGILFALSIVSKMLPMMFLPIFFKKLGIKRSFYFWAIVVGATLIFLLPIYNSLFISNISKSLGLYFKNFEFNASVFYIWKEIGIQRYGYNIIQQITPFLTLTVVVFIALQTLFNPQLRDNPQWQQAFFSSALMVVSLYFAVATTVHPWYAALPLACSVFTHWRFPMVWTFFIFLTYAGYTEGSSKHTENMYLLVLEYSVVYLFFIYEGFKYFSKQFSRKKPDC
ncbi:MAG: hypothetical protein JNL70_00705 [Saprospiraceae bacterium]|nr:hypothetical protein [Saprospiraceae bacterium]